MKKRPLSVTVVSCVFIAAGVAGLVYHASEWKPLLAFRGEIIWISFVRVLAIVAGVFMLRGRNWARWLAMAWLSRDRQRIPSGGAANHPRFAIHRVCVFPVSAGSGGVFSG